MQHESIPLSEEKQLLKEIKQLEATREKVVANAAMRAKIQDSLGQREDIQDQVKVRQCWFKFYALELVIPLILPSCLYIFFSLCIPTICKIHVNVAHRW